VKSADGTRTLRVPPGAHTRCIGAAGCTHPVHLGQHQLRIGNDVDDRRCNNTVEGIVVVGKQLGVSDEDVHVGVILLRSSNHGARTIESGNTEAVVGQVSGQGAGGTSDFEHAVAGTKILVVDPVPVTA